MIVPLQVGREKSVNALNAAVAEGGPIALVTQRQAEQEDITDPAELYGVGTLAKIAQVIRLQDGTIRAIVQGQERIRLLDLVQTEPHLEARVEVVAGAAHNALDYEHLLADFLGSNVGNGLPTYE